MDPKRLAHLIADILDAPGSEAVARRVAGEVREICARFPVYRPEVEAVA